jgi:hypothetical protein
MLPQTDSIESHNRHNKELPKKYKLSTAVCGNSTGMRHLLMPSCNTKQG